MPHSAASTPLSPLEGQIERYFDDFMLLISDITSSSTVTSQENITGSVTDPSHSLTPTPGSPPLLQDKLNGSSIHLNLLMPTDAPFSQTPMPQITSSGSDFPHASSLDCETYGTYSSSEAEPGVPMDIEETRGEGDLRGHSAVPENISGSSEIDHVNASPEPSILNQHVNASPEPSILNQHVNASPEPSIPNQHVNASLEPSILNHHDPGRTKPTRKEKKLGHYITDNKLRRDTFYNGKKRLLDNLYLLGHRTNCYGYLYLRR